MDCEQALALISAQIDGEIGVDERAALDAHLKACTACTAMAEAFRLQHADLQRTFEPRRSAAAAVAQQVVEQLDAPAKPAPRTHARRIRRAAGVALMAASVAGIGILMYFFWLRPSHPQADDPKKPATESAQHEGLTPRPRTDPPAVARLGVGEEIKTAAGERRRTALPDGSILYVNQATTVKLVKEHRLALSNGEVFLEISKRPRNMSDAFTVETSAGEVLTLGTKFAVRTENGTAKVLVTQGEVRAVHGSASVPVQAGEEIDLKDQTRHAAPRASHALAWTRDLMAAAESPLVPASDHQGGDLVAVDPYGQEAKLSLRKYHVDVHIEDGFARTTIDQTYFNHNPWRMEGTFYFPLPPDASLSRLAMYVDGKLMEGGMAERDYARRVYEEIMYSQRDPALLEWVDGSTFKMRVFPLEGRQEKRIVLSYTQRLASAYGRTQYRFPAGHNLLVVRDWSLHVRAKNAAKLAWSTESHPKVKATRDGNDLILDDVANNVAVNRDVTLNLFERESRVDAEGVVRFASAEHEGAKYLMLRYRPRLSGEPTRQRRDWVFLFESSGDRDPLLARAQIDVIRGILANVERDDTFVILTAGTRVHALSDKPQDATAENIKNALALLEHTHLIGALDLGRALDAVKPFVKDSKNPCLVHVGSGIAALGERRDNELAKRISEGMPYVGVGVGKRWARSFMKTAAERTGGYFTQINPDEPIGWRAFELCSTLNAPRLLDIKVTDKAGKAVFLNYTNSLAQGEDLCAITRVEGGKLPEAVVVTGAVAGKEHRREVKVEKVAAEADYLPRTWAKLEIDRLLADDARSNKDKIIELSKAMYVMTPYTSLLVLENEAMYKQFKVDRGRKDHWAMYPCPPEIPVIYEPDPLQPVDERNAPKTAKPQVNQVLQTIMVRVPPRILSWPNQGRDFRGNQTVKATELYGSASGLANGLGSLRTFDINGVGALFDDDIRDGTSQTIGYFPPAMGLVVKGTSRIHSASPELSIMLTDRARKGKDREMERLEPLESYRPYSYLTPTTLSQAGSASGVAFSPDGRHQAVAMRGFVDKDGSITSFGLPEMGRPSPLEKILMQQGEAGPRDWMPLSGKKSRPISVQRDSVSRGDTPDIQEQLGDLLEDSMPNVRMPSVEYRRPYFSGDERVFSDLVAYAPGMNTSQADIQAVLEAEAAPQLRSAPGRIEPDARELIEQARKGGWKRLTLKGKDGKPGFTFLFDASGRYAYERVLPLGLRERVVCDGKTMLHVYPELGIGARRQVSRFHRAEIAGLVPWVLPPAEDLAHGTDLRLKDKRTVAIVPRDIESAKDRDGKQLPYLAVHLVFAEDGRLAERQLLRMPDGKTLLRETYDPSGTVKVLNAEGKELSVYKPILSAADAPDLRPDTSQLVVLPLPLRSREHVYQAHGMDTGKALTNGDNQAYYYFGYDDALELFATEYAAGNGLNAKHVYLARLHKNGERRLGFFTLLMACGFNVSAEPAFRKIAAEQSSNPLAGYLTLTTYPVYRTLQRDWDLNLGAGIDGQESFLSRLAAFRDIHLRWRNSQANQGSEKARHVRQEHALGFVKRNKSSVLGLAALTLLQDQAGDDKPFHRAIAEAWRALDDESGLAYIPRYEHARGLLHGGGRAEARILFRELYAKALKENVLPPIDGDFRSALQSDGDDSDLWTELMRKTAEEWTETKHGPAAVALAWQCWQLDDQPLSENLLALVLSRKVAQDVRTLENTQDWLQTRLFATEFLQQTERYARADDVLQEVLADNQYSGYASLWRRSAGLAQTAGRTQQSIQRLERALDIENRHVPEIIDLRRVRDDHATLLNHYRSLADSARALNVEPPADLVSRTIRAADRWRALDRESDTPCQSAAAILKTLGRHDLAWDYLTTPLGQKPNEADPWLRLAQTLSREGQPDLADRAYAAAFEAEPTNAQILWDRAQNLRQAGKTEEARRLMRQIADTDWQPRFRWIRGQARWQLEGR
jgi:ferric-dicitrate binding protein FerR (iron transport regulator)/tetratricopeptide (TPR) repeat protein